MPKKIASIVDAEEGKTPTRPKPELVRVEESIEDFIKSQLPTYAQTKLEICPLFTDRSGRQYFRCKFWKYSYDSIVVTRREERSHFVFVEATNGKRVLVDNTSK